MDIIMSRSDASRISSGLELLVRLSLGQFDEINMVNRMSRFGDGDFDRKMRLSDALSDDIQSWRESVLGMSPGGYFGIFSSQVSDEAREMMAISKMLREGVVAGHTDADREVQAPEWRSIDLDSALLAYNVSCRAKASVFVGARPSGLPKEVETVVCEEGSLKVGGSREDEEEVSIFLSLPAVELEWFFTLAGMGYRAYWSITQKEGYESFGLSAIEEWIERDPSRACVLLREHDTGVFMSIIKKVLNQL